VRSLGTTDAETATEIRAFLLRLKRYGRYDVLDLIAGRYVSARDLYQAEVQGLLTQAVNRARALMAEQAETDLDPVLAMWADSGGAPRYVSQCRRLIVEGERFPVSRFTRRTLSEFLRALPVSNPTRNRYRAALSQFARFLVERELIAENPLRAVAGFKEHAPRDVYYDDATARAVVSALEQPYRALEALMCGSGIEWGAAVTLKRADVTPETHGIIARGTKTKYRRYREMRVLDDWCWSEFWSYARAWVGDLPYFADVDHREALAAHRAAVQAVRAPASTLHDWRHTFAVRERRKGTPMQIIKHQLGHAPGSTVVERVYGAFSPLQDDYERLQAQSTPEGATHSATRRKG